jgi:hypothetical protein
LKKLPHWTPRKNFLLNRSFSGGPGGRLFKKAPLAAGGILFFSRVYNLSQIFYNGLLIMEVLNE